jgi:hypothetical protein
VLLVEPEAPADFAYFQGIFFLDSLVILTAVESLMMAFYGQILCAKL